MMLAVSDEATFVKNDDMYCVNALKLAKSVYQLSLEWDNYKDCIKLVLIGLR